jgi:hypothetical protein
VRHFRIPFRHGDMLYLTEKKTLDSFPVLATSLPAVAEVKVEEDDVDKLLATRDGRVHRKKDPQMEGEGGGGRREYSEIFK